MRHLHSTITPLVGWFRCFRGTLTATRFIEFLRGLLRMSAARSMSCRQAPSARRQT